MAVFLRRQCYVFPRPQTIARFFFNKRSNCTLAEGEMDRHVIVPQVDSSIWKKVNARAVGIKRSMISASSWTVLRVLRDKGFEAYLVGGCVRDLLLNRVPKDFDVITTANLKQIRRQFNRAQIIGKRFPICQVWIRGSITEVSSFDTVAVNASKNEDDLENAKGKDDNPDNTEENETTAPFEMPCGIDKTDYNRWRNSIHRDFTINSLFLDPFDFKIYDYTNGIQDLKALKLRTLIPAHLSFKEDCARILRGLRIAARLALSFSKDIETAIPEFVSSIATLDQFRLMMEMNYMLSYGAAWPSILLLRRFNLLRIFLPFQAAYLEQAGKDSPVSSMMLMKLLSNMDKLVFCDQPADCRLWIALLAFHTALVRDPQDALVVCTFGSVLYHGHWKEAVKYARKHEKSLAKFFPEVSKSSENFSDKEIAEAVTRLTVSLRDSLCVLSEMDDLREALSAYSDSQCSGLVFVPKRKVREVSEAFDDLVNDMESYEIKRKMFSINYYLLGSGDPAEMRFVLGKIILDTMTVKEATVRKRDLVDKENDHKTQKFAKRNDSSTLSNPAKVLLSRIKNEKKHGQEASIPEPKQKASKRLRANDNKLSESMQNAAANDELKAKHSVSNKESIDKLLNLAVRSNTSKQTHFSEEKDNSLVSTEDEIGSSTLSNPAKNLLSRIMEQQHGHETSIPEPKQKASKRLRANDNKLSKSKQNGIANNEEAIESPSSKNLKMKHGVSDHKSISELLKVAVRSNMKKQTHVSEEKVNSLVSREDESGREKTERPRKKPPVGNLSSLFR